MKYSIRESSGPYPSELLRYGKIMGEANNAELEFWARIQELENALDVAQQRLHAICGATMAMAHNEPEENVWAAIHEMGPDMDIVSKALNK